MKVQVLVAAMHQTDRSLPQKMNLQSDAIIGNQCEENSVEELEYNGHTVRYLNFAERGVGLNRNNALMRATGDICLFADDDMRYEDGYAETIAAAFEGLPQADVIVFNLKEETPTRAVIRKTGRVGWLNFLRYGTARVAVKNAAVQAKGIYFNQQFGGGTPHCHGEDNLFLASCLKNGLKIYAVPLYLATLTEERQSSWNQGYDEKYLRDQGALYKTMSRRLWWFWCLQDALRHHKRYGVSAWTAYRLMAKSK